MYEMVYDFEVFTKIREGKRVYALDRKEKNVLCVNDIHVETAIQYLNNKENNRFEFWAE